MMFTVHVAANEGRNGGGAFMWFVKPKHADEEFERDKRIPNSDCYRLDMQVSRDPAVKGNNQAITAELELKFTRIGFMYDQLPLLRRHPRR